MILLIDNYDSFTYNLFQYLNELGADTKVYPNDQITLTEITQLKPEKIVISPGPGTPNKAGISLNIIKEFSAKIPILGVCLGHQAIAQVFGAKIMPAKQPIHGKTADIYHKNQSIFKDIKNPFNATRYHSLIVDKRTLPPCLTITAWTQNENGDIDEIMGIAHQSLKTVGIQFHPESIATEFGHELLQNFLWEKIN